MSDIDDWGPAVDGDGQAFARIFDRHRDRVFRHSVRLVGSHSDAEDAVVVVFLELWRKRRTVRIVDGSVLPWLLVTATNASRNISRSGRRYRALLEKLPPPDTDSGWHDDADPAVLDAFRRLSRAHQEVLALCVLDGFSEAEASRVLSVPAGTVKSRLARARRALEKELPSHLTRQPDTEGQGREHAARTD